MAVVIFLVEFLLPVVVTGQLQVALCAKYPSAIRRASTMGNTTCLILQTTPVVRSATVLANGVVETGLALRTVLRNGTERRGASGAGHDNARYTREGKEKELFRW